jgi:hypothetical protein
MIILALATWLELLRLLHTPMAPLVVATGFTQVSVRNGYVALTNPAGRARFLSTDGHLAIQLNDTAYVSISDRMFWYVKRDHKTLCYQRPGNDKHSCRILDGQYVYVAGIHGYATDMWYFSQRSDSLDWYNMYRVTSERPTKSTFVKKVYSPMGQPAWCEGNNAEFGLRQRNRTVFDGVVRKRTVESQGGLASCASNDGRIAAIIGLRLVIDGRSAAPVERANDLWPVRDYWLEQYGIGKSELFDVQGHPLDSFSFPACFRMVSDGTIVYLITYRVEGNCAQGDST